MKEAATKIETIKAKYKHLAPFLNERANRMWCATEALALGHGGVTLVHKATGVTRKTIHKGLKELALEKPIEADRIRRKGVLWMRATSWPLVALRMVIAER